MKKKLILAIIAASFVQTLVIGQSRTYSVELAAFSSEKFDELSPVYYKNGIVFCSNRNKSFFLNYLTSENKGLFKIFYIDTINIDKVQKIKFLSKDLKTKFNDGPASFSREGDTIYFSRNLKVNGSLRENTNQRNKLGIFTAISDGRNWVKIRDLRFNNEYYNITTPCISPDGKRLYFASDNPAGFGGSDLYYCQMKGDYWDDPVNLGPEINTSGNESYPFVNREGALFFSSDGHPGLGGKDIFYTKQAGGKWLPPVRLDEPVNSQSDDFGFVADSIMNEGFFSSRRGNSSVDIYRFKTKIHQLFYCENERANQYCFKFSDEEKIKIDDRNFLLVWSFGDGGKASGSNVEHCFTGPGKYSVKLDIAEKNTGRIFFTKLSYNLELKDIEQPVINAPGSSLVGETVNIDGLSSAFPGSRILNYTWDFGDGGRIEGGIMRHKFSEKGDYNIKLGLIVRDERTGLIRNACVSKQFRVFEDKHAKSEFDARKLKPLPRLNINDYDHAFISDLYSVESGYNQDVVFNVEVITSRYKLQPDNSTLKNIPARYSVREIFFPDRNLYSYGIDEEMSLMATYPAFNDMITLGFKNIRIISYPLEDPAAKELNNLKRVFGVSADAFFKKNDFSLVSAGTQVLDLIIGYLSKYPNVRLEISTHTDNQGTASTSQLLSQKRADAMVSYLVVNGVSPTKVVAKGYGGTRPIAPNYSESDRMVNRRVDFTIIR